MFKRNLNLIKFQFLFIFRCFITKNRREETFGPLIYGMIEATIVSQNVIINCDEKLIKKKIWSLIGSSIC
mgnify:CR=1 FL=1